MFVTTVEQGSLLGVERSFFKIPFLAIYDNTSFNVFA